MAITIGDVTYTRGVTHPGVFHADDVCAAALLRLVDPGFPIERRNPAPEGEPDDTLVFDQGGGKFDHHQREAEVRDNGVPYSSFGLVWRELGERISGSKEAADVFDKAVVQSVDSHDNTGKPSPFAGFVIAKRQNTDASDMDRTFTETVDVLVPILECAARSLPLQREHFEGRADGYMRDCVRACLDDACDRYEHAHDENLLPETEESLYGDAVGYGGKEPHDESLAFVIAALGERSPQLVEDFTDQLVSDRQTHFKQLEAARNRILAQMEAQNNPRVLILEAWEPNWNETCQGTNTVFAMFPSPRGGWNVQGVRKAPGSSETACPIPQDWRGLAGDALVQASGIKGATFCHKGGFMIACKDKESAMQAADRMIELAQEPRRMPYVPPKKDEPQASFSL
jgi:uncharacterized UPF0160 family protein